MTAVLALCYHAVSPSWPWVSAVTPERLEEQARLLLRRGYRPATFSDAVLGNRSGRTFAITFDDGYRSVFEHGLPVLAALGVPATVFVPTALMGGGRLAWPGVDHWLDGPHAAELTGMTWEQLGRLCEAGWEIGSHTRTHPRLTRLADAELALELSEAREECERRLGRPCRSIAYPYGDVDARVVLAARAAGHVAGGSPPVRLPVPPDLVRPRVGVYRRDDLARFRLKVAAPVHWAWRSRAWPLVRAVGRRVARDG